MTVKELAKENALIEKAYEIAEKAHAPQKRKTGEPYFNHCLATAQAVADWKLDEQSIAAALLHDVVEDTDYSLEKIRENFGEEIAFLVDGVTKLGKIKYRGVEAQVENLRKMILALSRDIRVVLIKLADRLHNMKTLSSLPPPKQKRIALETLEIYSPLAYRLGMQHIAGELEDLAFPYIYPQEYKWLTKTVQEKYEARERYLKKVEPMLRAELKKNNIPAVNINYRAKRYYSLYKKLLRYDMDVEKIYDLVALRVIVPTVSDCYAALGIVHKLWPPLPGRFKDYIALPKPNGYRSLHTTVFCVDGKITEIQIKTQEMHEEAENGIAAHWAYEEAKGGTGYLKRQAVAARTKDLAWVQQLRNWQKEFSDPEEFMQSLKIDFFTDRIFVITPKGEVIDLPVGSTPIDFAYQIHTEVGNHASGARVNGKIVPLDQRLQSGNVVDILTQKNKRPSESWLQFAKSGSAKNHIRSALRQGGGVLKPQKPKRAELKIMCEDRIGLLKDITSIISRSHVNMNGVQSGRTGRFVNMKIGCETADKTKIEKIILKLKKGIKEIKEVGYVLK
ncbi:MAG: RelA/SpoT family protein [Parcubacteria group bacterium]|nr:RelA/SpoT family protein [Parcubacteria group bacterium]